MRCDSWRLLVAASRRDAPNWHLPAGSGSGCVVAGGALRQAVRKYERPQRHVVVGASVIYKTAIESRRPFAPPSNVQDDPALKRDHFSSVIRRVLVKVSPVILTK